MKAKNLLILISCVIFLAFFSNVIAGAAGIGVFLSDVGEMLILFTACICFVVAVLAHERSAAADRADATNRETRDT